MISFLYCLLSYTLFCVSLLFSIRLIVQSILFIIKKFTKKLRRVFYACMVLMEDEETQKKGRVYVVWINPETTMDRTTSWSIAQLTRALPARFSAIHLCLEQQQPKQSFVSGSIMALARLALESLSRVRSRTHVGT